MYRVFENFVKQLSASVDTVDLHDVMASAAAGFDFPLFAYFSYPSASGQRPRLISNYPSSWTSQYLQLRYHSHDPVILRGLQGWDTFDWGVDRPRRCLPASQQEILEKAAHFGIRGGLTMSVHDPSRPVCGADLRFRPVPSASFVLTHTLRKSIATCRNQLSYTCPAQASRRSRGGLHNADAAGV
ncbi:autoinducer binding domain-containing protein [Mesorhizobium sp. WSM3862]|uniref:autoinducer binding domain-containing protein n=1 Tax=Mesorhizobium sp. WSM3862 TaxID=632858 RepID=UPI001FDFFAAC|nr:autoinducer binding domain-containing protein [Mesorhizobium sp. WSM3862]